MIELEDFTPTSTLGPTRTAEGVTLGRETTTDEQRQEAVEHVLAAVAEHGEDSGRVTVHWSRSEPTVLVVTTFIEKINGKRTWFVDSVSERTMRGAEIPRNERARVERLIEEVNDLQSRGMLA